MNDLIERKAVIEAIENVDWYHQNRNKDMVSGANDDEHQAWYKADDIYKALEAVPSARPKGEWIDGDVPTRCSICGHDWDEYVEGQEIWYEGSIPNFCPNCGAKMKGADDE